MAGDENGRQGDVLYKIKIGLLALMGIVVIIFLLSNLETMKLKFLFGLLTMDGPLAFFIFLFILLGFIAGFATCLFWLRRGKIRGIAEEIRAKDSAPPAQEPGKTS